MTKTQALTGPVILLLTLLASACSIEPLTNATEPTDQTNEPNQPDQNEPANGNVNTDQPTELTYISCREARSCAGLADCFGVFAQLCESPPSGGFYCGDERATLHVRGTLSSPLECGEAVVAALDCCADISRIYEGAE